MAGTSTTQISDALRKDLYKGMALWSSDKKPNEGERLVGGNVVTDTQSFIKIAQFTRPTGPGQVGERQVLPEGRYDKVRTATYAATKYGMLLTFSSEVWKDNQYPDVVMKGYGTDLMDLFFDVRDQALVNEFHNLMGSNTGPDGQYYADTDHPLDAEAAELTDDYTAVASNVVTNNPTVSTEALNDAADLLARQRDNKGRIMACLPPFVVECHSKRAVLWRSIATPVNGYEPFQSDRNSGKVYSEMISEVIGLTRSTHTDYWSLRTANSRQHHRFVWDREKTRVSEMEYIKRDDTMECNAIMRLSKGIFDWRGVVSSLAGS